MIAVGFVLALFLREVKLSDVAGMVARGEALAADGSGDRLGDRGRRVVVDDLSAGGRSRRSADSRARGRRRPAPAGNLRP